jgi:lantibiotic modifying enzyme
MLCASFMYRWTEEARWREEFRHQADRLLADWREHDSVGWLWTQDLYGSMRAFLGPVHGFAGNAIPLIEGRNLLDPNEYSVLAEKLMATTVSAAITDKDHANWPAVYNAEKPEKLRLTQHCHGAPGMISALSKLPKDINPEFDAVLLKGGELTWHAGPLKKGANLCHGTAGNGYAFLKLYERTGNEHWLERARAFAMESIDQFRQTKALFHQARHTLWTGDLGTACYQWDCIEAKPRFPSIDVF